MIQYLYPDPLLGKYIRNYFLMDWEFETGVPVPIKVYPPHPEQGITFYIRGEIFAETPELGIAEKRAKSVVFGHITCRQNLQPPPEYTLFEVRFQPGAFYKLFRIPMTEFVDLNIDAELIFGPEIKEVHEKMANANQKESFQQIFENFIGSKIKQSKEFVRPIDKIGQMILADPEKFNSKAFANEACLSLSQFERLFFKQVGVSPKFYARICRFHKAYIMKEQNPGLDWLRIAVETGYSDYQHLVKDFKQFSGSTPNTLIKESALAPERVFGFDMYPKSKPN